MARDAETVRRAKERILARRLAAERDFERERAELYERAPLLRAVDRALADTGSAAARAALLPAPARGERLSSLREEAEMLRRRRGELLADAGHKGPLAPRYRCAACGDTGMSGGGYCGCLQEEIKRLTAERVNRISPLSLSRFENFSLERYSGEPDPETGLVPRAKMAEVLAYCRAYAEHAGDGDLPNAVMMGPTGLGKTHLSLAIAREAIAAGKNVIYGSFLNLLSQLEDEHFGRADGNTLAPLLSCDLLVIDDLGAEFTTSFAVATLYNILNTRLGRALPTILSTNLTLPQISERYNDRISSRIVGHFEMLRFVGRDIREQKAMNA